MFGLRKRRTAVILAILLGCTGCQAGSPPPSGAPAPSVSASVGADRCHASNEVDCLIAAARKRWVDIAIVGSEALLRGDSTAVEIIALINRFRAAVPGVPVTTADTPETLLSSPVLAEVDVLWIHAHPYCAGVAAERAGGWVQEVWAKAARLSAGRPVWIGEVGWPSSGAQHVDAEPSPANQARVLADVLAWTRVSSSNVAWFDLVDEGCKREPGGVGPHWGVFEQDLGLKLAARCVLPALLAGDDVRCS